uniref:Isocitrate dehydrogenase [NAD] subunit, mitochondrial n=1 Tax=Parastrongyloides trichosuri TaxID=131310 RepID=A0A0N4Z643_PARTI
MFPICKVLGNINKRAFCTTAAPVEEIAKKLSICLIPGDGVGPELTQSVQEVVKHTGIPIEFEEIFVSGIHYKRSTRISEVLEALRRNNNVCLKGVIQESVYNRDNELKGLNMKMRKDLDLFANVVHIKTMEGIKTRHGKKLDFIIIREQTEGEYSAIEHESVPGVIECLKISTRPKIERIAKFAFDYAMKYNRKRVTCVHKANIMKLGDGLFLNICKDVSKLYPKIEFDQMIVDNTCMQLVSNPDQFDVMVMPNLYGNIIDNLAAGLVGGAGVVPSKSIGSDFVMFEPGSKHSFQQALGRDIANPTAMILACSNLLHHVHLDTYSIALRKAVEKTIREGKVRTRDLGGYASATDFTYAVIENYQI